MAQGTCSVEGCTRPIKVVLRQLCAMHYHRWQRHGDPTKVLRKKEPYGASAEQRFWAKVDKNGPIPAHRPDLGPCWVWTASRLKFGHGSFGAVTGSTMLAHRFSYELLVGPIPEGLALDHLCVNPPCVNPAHLEPVTSEENTRRAFARFVDRTHCPAGHALTPENSYFRRPGRPLCKTCRREQHRAWRTGPGRESVRRSDAKRLTGRPVGQPRRTHCKNGHPFDEDNTYLDPRGKRRCRACRAEYDRQRKAS